MAAPPRRSVLAKLVLSLASTALLLLAGEATARLSGRAPTLLDLEPRIWGVPPDLVERALARVGPKAPGTLRIAAFGASTVKGWPYPESSSFANALAPVLSELRCERPVDVVNLAWLSIDATDVAGVMERAQGVDADLYLVLTGHNELANRIFWTRPPELVWSLARRSALVRLVVGALGERRPLVVAGEPGDDPTLRDAERELLAMAPGELGRPIFGRLPVPPEERGPYVERYGRALGRMVALARARGVPIVFCEPVSNLRDYAPLFPTPRARAAFERGRERLAAGDGPGALAAFEEAQDEDGAPARVSAPFLERLRAVCRAEGAPLVPLRAELARDGAPGFDLFIDMLHPTAGAHARLAVATARALVRHGLVPPVDEGRWAAVEEGARLVAEPGGGALRSDLCKYMGILYLAAGNLAGAREQLARAVELGADGAAEELLRRLEAAPARRM